VSVKILLIVFCRPFLTPRLAAEAIESPRRNGIGDSTPGRDRYSYHGARLLAPRGSSPTPEADTLLDAP